ncbi:SIS domain-containing protein [Photobacterium gaetbulicola]|uniref:Putative GmhA protein n=1 Tax=Photobacterium gaetbulicola Gung47 TaxID=658445 RepID=A0A0C5WH28_9GAMM|nr:SIS domain-containing protein [Photobacterium gaetbulicola]AJR05492.1 putative GmhA protein [Photobacterium gaetbulicola Gung47]PST99767.1 SIS domain-containing protein [Photobacterium gaetbulicola]
MYDVNEIKHISNFLYIETVINHYFRDLKEAIDKLDVVELTDASSIVFDCLHKGNTLYVCGNGGSASSASHLAADLANETRSLTSSPNIVSLVDSLPRITAIGNDYGYDEIFSLQLNKANAGDVILMLSVSGNSENLINAAKVAKEKDVKVVSLLGRKGNLAEYSTSTVVFGMSDYGITEDLHSSFLHMVKRLVNEGKAHICKPSL